MLNARARLCAWQLKQVRYTIAELEAGFPLITLENDLKHRCDSIDEKAACAALILDQVTPRLEEAGLWPLPSPEYIKQNPYDLSQILSGIFVKPKGEGYHCVSDIVWSRQRYDPHAPSWAFDNREDFLLPVGLADDMMSPRDVTFMTAQRQALGLEGMNKRSRR